MGLVQRLRAGLSSALAAPPDPRPAETSFTQRLGELQGRLQAAMTGNAAAGEKLEARLAGLDGRRDQLLAEARSALEHGREEQARTLLRRRYDVAQQQRLVNRQLAALAAVDERLQQAQQRLSVQLDAVRARWDAVAARYTAADARRQLDESADGLLRQLLDSALLLVRVEAQAIDLEASGQTTGDLVAAETGELLDRTPQGTVEQPLSDPEAAELEAEFALLELQIAADRRSSADGGRAGGDNSAPA